MASSDLATTGEPRLAAVESLVKGRGIVAPSSVFVGHHLGSACRAREIEILRVRASELAQAQRMLSSRVVSAPQSGVGVVHLVRAWLADSEGESASLCD